MALTRRSFLRLLGLGAAGVAAIPCLPSLQPAKPPRPQLSDDKLGIAIRYVQQYDIEADRFPTRMYCDYVGTWYTDHACRVLS
jgi:hypothetical protein